MTARVVRPIEVASGPRVLDQLVPALGEALDGGPPVLPVPEGGGERAARLLRAMRPAEPLPTDAAVVVQTSGSTGEPKGVLLSAAALRASAAAALDRLGGPGPWLCALPATHIGGLQVLVRSVLTGNTPVVLDLTAGFDPENFAAATVRLFAATSGRRYTALVPTQLRRILQAGGAVRDAARAYTAILVGGAAVPAELLREAADAELQIVTTYGCTETAGGCVYDGRPLDGVSVRVNADGRIQVTGPVLASGYRTATDSVVFSDSWFTTKDLGRLDDDGRLIVLGRVDDVVISGGRNVPLSAVEAVIADHPEVRDVACAGVEDAEWGHRIAAVIVARNPGSPPNLESVRSFVASRAPASYPPRQLIVVERLPMLANGKVDRLALVELARQNDALKVG
jgi:O-succinylbenzoic acid--CoA ligase